MLYTRLKGNKVGILKLSSVHKRAHVHSKFMQMSIYVNDVERRGISPLAGRQRQLR